MTSQDLVEAPARDRFEWSAYARRGEHLREAASGTLGAARAADPGGALVAVVGLGRAGLPSAIALRRAGMRILGIDTCTSRMTSIRSGRARIARADWEYLRAHLGEDDFELTDSIEAIAGAAGVLICVPTIADRRGVASADALRRTCAAVVEQARAGQTFVLSTTTYVGSTRELLVEPLSARGLCVGEDVFVAFSPARGDAEAGVDEPAAPRVIGAVTERCFARAAELVRPLSHELLRVSSPAAAEMARLYESTFRAVNVALAFEMADACRTHALDPIEVTDAAASNTARFMAHYP